MKLLRSRLMLVALFCVFSAAPALAACGRGVSPLRCLFASLHALRSAHLGPSDHRGARPRPVRFAAGHGSSRARNAARRTRREALAVAGSPAAAHRAPRLRVPPADAGTDAPVAEPSRSAPAPAADLQAPDRREYLAGGAPSASPTPLPSPAPSQPPMAPPHPVGRTEDAGAAASPGLAPTAPPAASAAPEAAPAPVEEDQAGAIAATAAEAGAPVSERRLPGRSEAANAPPPRSDPEPAKDQRQAVDAASDAPDPPDAPAAARPGELAAAGSGADAAAIRRLFGLSDHPADGPSPAVGAAAAPDLDLRPLPAAFVALRPYLADLGYFIADDHVVLVFPATRLIVMTY